MSHVFLPDAAQASMNCLQNPRVDSSGIRSMQCPCRNLLCLQVNDHKAGCKRQLLAHSGMPSQSIAKSEFRDQLNPESINQVR